MAGEQVQGWVLLLVWSLHRCRSLARVEDVAKSRHEDRQTVFEVFRVWWSHVRFRPRSRHGNGRADERLPLRIHYGLVSVPCADNRDLGVFQQEEMAVGAVRRHLYRHLFGSCSSKRARKSAKTSAWTFFLKNHSG